MYVLQQCWIVFTVIICFEYLFLCVSIQVVSFPFLKIYWYPLFWFEFRFVWHQSIFTFLNLWFLKVNIFRGSDIFFQKKLKSINLIEVDKVSEPHCVQFSERKIFYLVRCIEKTNYRKNSCVDCSWSSASLTVKRLD